METNQPADKPKLLPVTIDPAFSEYKDKIMFPKKLEQANKVLKTAKLPPNKNLR